jgi:hypothetical protein
MLGNLRRFFHGLRLAPGGDWDVGMTTAKRARPKSWVDTLAPWWSHGPL